MKAGRFISNDNSKAMENFCDGSLLLNESCWMRIHSHCITGNS